MSEEIIKPTLSRRHDIGNGTQDIYRFENGYGASVVRFRGSYGYPSLFELGVIEFQSEDPLDFHLTYRTRITKDVLGYLTPEDVQKVLRRIAKLRSRRKTETR